ncbi:MAG: hypothetical protein ACI9HK_002722 [Pirellulaceae bacterium]|jgi:hypothetical protein
MNKTISQFLAIVLISLCTSIVSASNVWAVTPEEAQQQSLSSFQADVRPLLARFCFECHGDKKQQAKVRLSALDPDMADGSDGETWHDALNQLNQGDMPPEKAKQPSIEEREMIVRWMTAELKRAIAVKRSTGGQVVMRRLARYEYDNTMRDLLGVHLDFSKDLPADAISPDGLGNNGSVLRMSPLLIEHYLKMARTALAKAIVTDEPPQLIREEHGGDQLNREGFGQGSERQVPSGGIMTFKNYPHAGEFRVEVRLSSNAEDNMPIPIMGVYLGKRASPNNFHIKLVDEVKITSAKGEPHSYEVRGRLEDFPLIDPATPLREQRNPGMRIGFHDSYRPEFGAPKRGTKPTGPKGFTIHSVVFEAALNEQWPPRHHTNILFPSELVRTDERAYARQVIERFMQRAFRRPVSSKEVDRSLAVYDDLRPNMPSLEFAMREVLAEVLVAPDFLFLVEPTDGKTEKQPLSNHELASRLSYFLSSTMPDERLFELAQKGDLNNPTAIAKLTRAMLDDKRSWNFVTNFTDQWLDLSGINRVAVNPDYYPNFDHDLKEHMSKETQHFFAELLHKNLSALNLIDSDFAMLNRPLAKHYGLSGPPAEGFVRVALEPNSNRGGLLGQASILLRNSDGQDSHPIYRGAWIRDRLLGDPAASPPPDVPELDADNPEFESLSLKKQLELHRNKESCNICHRDIDPWGIPLENFDAVGVFRTERRFPVGKRGPPNKKTAQNKRPKPVKGETQVASRSPTDIEVTSILPGGHEIHGFAELKDHLLNHERDRFVRAFVRRLLAYGLGRSLELTDQPTVDKLVKSFEKSEYKIDELIVSITTSEPFRTK